jgi:pimeloyl-ACP methyl ester carboxylesterase
MTNYVLIGGAWIGAWAWKDVAMHLRAHGHNVYPLSLTGLGERAHLGRPEVNLETHITDVTNLVEFEDLSNVVLVGHSYAGLVVTGVADRLGSRLSALVYLDSAPFLDGECHLDPYPPSARENLERVVAEYGDGWRLPFPSFEELGANASLNGLTLEHRSLMLRHAVAQPFQTYTQPLHLNGTGEGTYQRIIVACEDGQHLLTMPIPRFQALNMAPWHVIKLDTGHWPMLSEPSAVAEILEGITA